MIVRTDGVVLRRTPWSNTSWLVWGFTRACGAVRAFALGARRQNRRRPQKAPDLFALGEMVLFRSQRSELSKLAAWEETIDFVALRAPERLFAAGRVARVVLAMTLEGEAHPALMDAILIAFTRLSEGQPSELVVRAFELAALAVLGHAPVLERCAASDEPIGGREKGLRWCAAEGGVVLPAHARERDPAIGPEALALARRLAAGGSPAGLAASTRALAELRACLEQALSAAAERPIADRRRLHA